MKNKAFKRSSIILGVLVFTPLILFALYGSEMSAFDKSREMKFDNDSLLALYGKNKILLAGYEKQSLLALAYYPELKDVYIEFKMVEEGSPFLSRPTVLSTLFRSARKRHYLVLVARHAEGWLGDILIDNMNFDAQVGVLGHELAHTANFIKRNFFQMTRVGVGNLSKAYLNEFEYATDQRAIDHGLGCNLLAWSNFVSSKVPLSIQQGPERYMRPETIRNKIEQRSESCK